jgi:tetratricopeptide (TPR) repeat protein
MALLSVTPAPAQQSDARIALVIGNAKYPDAGAPLHNVINDSAAMAEEFRRLQFRVDLKTNLSKGALQQAIDAFTGKIARGATALFYFSGFGLQVGRQTFLIPVNAKIWTEADVRRDGISIDALLAEMHRKGAKVKIIIVDAARRNPFERRFRAVPAGLAPPNTPVDTLVLYSAALNKLIDVESSASHSLFAAELKKELRTPDLTAEEIFNRIRVGVSRASHDEQVPWVASSLLGEFRFGDAPSALPPATAHTTPAPEPPAPAETPPESPKQALVKPAPAPPPNTPSGPPPVNDCDRLAAHPYDPEKTTDGVSMDDINVDRAMPACQSAVAAHPDTPRFHFQLGRVLQIAHRYDEALAEYRKAADGGHLQAMDNIGLSYLNGAGVPKNGSKALEWFRRAAAKGDAAGVAYIGYAHYLGQGVNKDYDLAIANFSEAIRRDRTYPLAYYQRGLAYTAKHDYDRAIGDYTEAIRLDPTFSYSYAQRGAVHRLKSAYDTAIADLSEAIRRNPKIGNFYIDRGIAYNAKNNFDRAIADYTEAIRLNPKLAGAYSNRGNAYRSKRDYNRAFADYAAAIRIAPNYAMAYFNRANAFMDEKKYNSAIDDLNEAIRLDPAYAFSYVARGRAYRALGKLDEALADYNEGIRRDGKLAVGYSDRGFVYEAKGRKDAAVADFRRALDLDPSNVDAKSGLERVTRTPPKVEVTDDLMGPVRRGYGALAYNQKEGRWAESYGYGSLAQAQRHALSACGGSDKGCQIAIAYHKFCGAVAGAADGSWSGGSGRTAKAAAQDAVNRCTKFSPDCKLLRVNCSR